MAAALWRRCGGALETSGGALETFGHALAPHWRRTWFRYAAALAGIEEMEGRQQQHHQRHTADDASSWTTEDTDARRGDFPTTAGSALADWEETTTDGGYTTDETDAPRADGTVDAGAAVAAMEAR